ncbi:MAG TPA: phosphatase PAP2 family protein [Gemmatimonadaceae bacterium]|jgi:undecaprenyl-diphosphatase
MFSLNTQRPRVKGASILAIGFVFALCAPWLLVAAANLMPDKTFVALFDDSVSNWLIQNATETFDIAFRFLSLFGGWVLVGVVAAAVVRLSLRKRMPQLAIFLVGTAGAVGLNLLLAFTFRRAHPVEATEFSSVAQAVNFPSGHAMLSLVIYGMLAFFCLQSVRLSKTRKTISVVGVAVLVVLISVARVYLAVHSVSDVVLGVVAGAAWLSTCIVASPAVAALFVRAKLTPSSGVRIVQPLAS